MSAVFKKWTEEERRAHVRDKNIAYQARKMGRTTLTEMRVKEQERQKKLELKARVEAGEWVTTGKPKQQVEKQESKEKQEKIVKKNVFSALESDEEESPKEEKAPTEYVRKRFNWADDSDDE